MSHPTTDIPVASVAHVTSGAVINTDMYRTSATMDQHSDPSVGKQKMLLLFTVTCHVKIKGVVRLITHDAKRAAGGYQTGSTKLSVVPTIILCSERESNS
jgi:hypothetical protein